MKKKILSLIMIISICFVTGCNDDPKKIEYKETDMKVVTSLEDKIESDTVWCGTFNLIWNDLKNELVKKDIVFKNQTDIINNLNKGTFNVNNLSEDSYYKVYDHPSLELKERIKEAIKNKFNETSDILDSFDFINVSSKDYFLYVMLKKNFEFEKEFTDLGVAKFRDKDAEYFGIDDETSYEVREQVKVLYYNNDDDFAIKLLTKGNDEVIISKGNTEDNFKNAYDKIISDSLKYTGKKEFKSNDTLKIPNIKFKLKKEIEAVENKEFKFANGDTYIISKALQTIEFELDKKGGKIKSEAGMMANYSSVEISDKRDFVLDDTFTIFLKEKNKDLPYFASRITNIKNVQGNLENY